MDCFYHSGTLCHSYPENALMAFTGKIKKGDRVAVMGLGVSGQAAVRFLLAMGADVCGSDAGEREQKPESFRDLLDQEHVVCEWGGHSLEFLLQAEAVIVSPGIPWDLDILNELRRQGVFVLGELGLAVPYITETVIAVTGTNGKTTVTRLIGRLLEEAGKKVFVGGNIGTPLLQYLAGDRDADILILELSSFQLEAAGNFSADVALLLNVTSDHLDRHGDMAHYTAAKAKIFAATYAGAVGILSGTDMICRKMALTIEDRKVQLFGYQKDCLARIDKNRIAIKYQGDKEYYDLRGTLLNTKTGALNSAAAILAAKTQKCKQADIQKALIEFSPDVHRMEFVAEYGGIRYYNDSKATNSGAVLAALENFAENVILIAGGRDKSDDFRILQKSVKEKVSLLILIGEAGGKIKKQLGDMTKVQMASSLEEAVECASRFAGRGDTVLLSPACASFDMFDNYGHRGEVFRQAVMALEDKQES